MKNRDELFRYMLKNMVFLRSVRSGMASKAAEWIFAGWQRIRPGFFQKAGRMTGVHFAIR